jgi:hypothetical protein
MKSSLLHAPWVCFWFEGSFVFCHVILVLFMLKLDMRWTPAGVKFLSDVSRVLLTATASKKAVEIRNLSEIIFVDMLNESVLFYNATI